jgi:hypothetical protein
VSTFDLILRRAQESRHPYSYALVKASGFPLLFKGEEFKKTDIQTALACIDHKSLEICDPCRLRQRTSPATPKIPLLFFEIRVQTGCLDFRISITALKVTRSVSLRAF